jgi:hypothetical protein
VTPTAFWVVAHAHRKTVLWRTSHASLARAEMATCFSAVPHGGGFASIYRCPTLGVVVVPVAPTASAGAIVASAPASAHAPLSARAEHAAAAPQPAAAAPQIKLSQVGLSLPKTSRTQKRNFPALPATTVPVWARLQIPYPSHDYRANMREHSPHTMPRTA